MVAKRALIVCVRAKVAGTHTHTHTPDNKEPKAREGKPVAGWPASAGKLARSLARLPALPGLAG